MDIEKFINENTMLNEVHTQLFSKSRLIQLLDKYTQALQLQQTGVMQRYFHPFVGAGSLVKETEKYLVIKLDFNGKEYFAPKHEFTELL